MAKSGDVVIVGKPEGEWMGWAGPLDGGWGSVDQAYSFNSLQAAKGYLNDARRGLYRQHFQFDEIYVARLTQPQVQWKGLVLHGGQWIDIDFASGDIPSGAMDQLGVL